MAPSPAPPLMGRAVWPRFRHLSRLLGFNMAGCLAADKASRGFAVFPSESSCLGPCSTSPPLHHITPPPPGPLAPATGSDKPSSSSASGTDTLQGPQAKNLIKQVLLTKPGGSDVLKEYEETGTISPATRKVMVNILVVDMVESEGRIPQRLTKKKYALAIVTLFPSLQVSHGKTGYEHYYDCQKGGGFLAWRLKSVQGATRLPVRSKDSRIEENGGPMLRREIGHCDNHPDEQRFQELISVMNHTNDREVIMKKMRDTGI
ncbi:hypothetical protein NQZ68_013308 [Dissostichus eleginoides]|nr:hypothetical protein NQZ68_013308 [Dissostichus eleginoides]